MITVGRLSRVNSKSMKTYYLTILQYAYNSCWCVHKLVTIRHIHFCNSPCWLCEWNLSTETLPILCSSNEVSVQLRCSWLRVVSAVLLLMSLLDHISQLLPISCSLWVGFHLLCASICVHCVRKYRQCKYIYRDSSVPLYACVTRIHINLYACGFFFPFFFTATCVLVCVGFHPDYQSFAVSLTTRAVSFDCIDFVLLPAVMKDEKWTACSEYEVIGLLLVSHGSQEERGEKDGRNLRGVGWNVDEQSSAWIREFVCECLRVVWQTASKTKCDVHVSINVGLKIAN